MVGIVYGFLYFLERENSMSPSIEHPEADRLARELAARSDYAAARSQPMQWTHTSGSSIKGITSRHARLDG